MWAVPGRGGRAGGPQRLGTNKTQEAVALPTCVPRPQVVLTFGAWPLRPWGGARSQPCPSMEKGPGKCAGSWALVMLTCQDRDAGGPRPSPQSPWHPCQNSPDTPAGRCPHPAPIAHTDTYPSLASPASCLTPALILSPFCFSTNCFLTGISLFGEFRTPGRT